MILMKRLHAANRERDGLTSDVQKRAGRIGDARLRRRTVAEPFDGAVGENPG